MKLHTLAVLTAAFLLSACATGPKQDNNFAFVNQVATQCTEQLQVENQYVTGKRTLAPIAYVNREFKDVGSSRAIPFFSAKALDKGSPGSAWRNCMARNDVKAEFIG
ncbi:hypothetical protein [Erwinia sp. V71]|uniref:hypothetical protein n=1 Tax=Erwinia sp. V71 TaxID=3369424 RepID=UPI003F5FB651